MQKVYNSLDGPLIFNYEDYLDANGLSSRELGNLSVQRTLGKFAYQLRGEKQPA